MIAQFLQVFLISKQGFFYVDRFYIFSRTG